GEIDSWSVLLRKGDLYDFDLRAGRLGSPLHGFLTLHDAAGKELARADGGAPGQVDPVLRFTATADGTYTVRVQERFRSRGGPAFACRLRTDRPAAPAFRLRLLNDAVTLPRGGQARVKVFVDRLGGFAAPVNLAFDGLPKGVTAAGTTVAPNQG